MRRPGSKLGWLFVLGGVFAFLLALLFVPAEAIVFAVVLGVLRLHPDRLVARAVLLAWSLPVALLRWVAPFHGPMWWQWLDGWQALTGDLTDSTAAALTGLTVGPWLAAGCFLLSQWRRERSPYRGADDLEARRRCEERRRRWTVQTAHRLAHTDGRAWVRRLAGLAVVPAGDTLGPILGRWQRGDLGRGELRGWRTGRQWDRLPRIVQRLVDRHGSRLRLPLGVPGQVRHVTVLGSTGSGKSESILGLAEWAVRRGWAVVYLSAKQPNGNADSVAPRLTAITAELGLSTRILAPSAAPFDPLRGSDKELIDRLISAQVWGDEYWRLVATAALTSTVEVRRSLHLPISALSDLTDTMTMLPQMAQRTRDRAVIDRVAAIDQKALIGATTRFRSLAANLGGWVGPARSGGFSFEDADVVVAELPTAREPEAAASLLRVLLHDFAAYSRDGGRRRHRGGQPRPVLFITEEAGAVAGDPVVGRGFLELVERGRSAAVLSVVSAQDLLGLGDVRVQSALLSNSTVLSFAQGPAAEEVAAMAGTRSAELGSISWNGYGVGSGGHTSRQRVTKFSSQTLRELGTGELLVAHRGRYALAAAGLTAAAYRVHQEEPPARPALDRGQTAAAPPLSPPVTESAAPAVTGGQPSPAAPAFASPAAWEPLSGGRG